jgi:hypothetical protein
MISHKAFFVVCGLLVSYLYTQEKFQNDLWNFLGIKFNGNF